MFGGSILRLANVRSAMTTDALFQQLLREPTPEHLRVYADLAQENGDPQGELIALQCAREDSGVEDGVRERDLQSALHLELSATLGGVLVQSEWRRGFVDTLRVTLSQSASNLSRLAEPKSLALLRRLEVTAVEWNQLGDLSAWWSRFPKLPRLEELRIEPSGRDDDFPPNIGVVAPLCTALQNLRSLELHGDSHRLENLVFPELRRFAASRLSASTIPALVHSRWPKLEVLELEFAPARPDEVEPLFGPLLDTTMSESLRRVTVKSPWPEFFAAALPRSPLGRGREVSV